MRRLLIPAGIRLWAAALLLTGLGVQDSVASGPNLLPFFKRQSLTTGLVAYWPLDSISGGTTTPDTSATTPSNTATLNGAPTTAAGKIGNGFVFTSASSQYLSVADAASLQFGTGSFSLAFWAKPSDLANKMRVLNKWDSTPATGWLLDFNADAAGANLGGAIRWRISDGPNNTALVTAGGVLTSTTTFAHIAAVADRSGGQLRLYVNGTEVAPSPMTINGNPDISDPGVNLGMGTILNGLGAYYSGMLDDVRIYNRALTPTEVQQLSTITGLPTAATNLMATTPAPPYGVVDLTWTGGTQVASYNVERSPQGQNMWTNLTLSGLPATANSYSDLTVTPGVGYDFRVVSVNGFGTVNSASASVSATAPVPPPKAPPKNNGACGINVAGFPGMEFFGIGALALLLVLMPRRRP